MTLIRLTVHKIYKRVFFGGVSLKKERNSNSGKNEYAKSRVERLADIIDLPKDIVSGLPKLIFTGSRELFIENYRGIVQYSDTVIQLNTSEGLVKVSGRALGIKSIAEEEITLYGNICSLEFC